MSFHEHNVFYTNILYIHRPRQLYFGCLKEASSGGGETSLCDFRKVYQEMDPVVRQKFEDKHVLYNRTHPKIGEKWTFDVGSMLSWRQMFATSDKQEVEAISKEEDGAPVQWIGPKNDTFFQSWQDDAVQLHPVTKEKVWFNHAQVSYCSMLQKYKMCSYASTSHQYRISRPFYIGISLVNVPR